MAKDTKKAEKKSFGETMRDIGKNIARDVSMGVSGGFGSFEKQAENLEKAGYSGAEIKDFQDRTKATMERNRLEAADRDRDRPKEKEPEPPPAPPPAPPAPPVVETPKPPPPPPPVNPSDTTPTGPVEAAAIESVQGGRASTILTSPTGLQPEEEPEGLLRDRRSLVGRGLIK